MCAATDNERGAALLMVIAFMVVVGAISAAVISTATSGLQSRVALDTARNRQYAADAAIETVIAGARALNGACPAAPVVPYAFNNVNVHVDCIFTPAVVLINGVPKLQNNLTFVACETPGPSYGSACTSPIITAMVNFQGTAPVKTYVQSWSVNA